MKLDSDDWELPPPQVEVRTADGLISVDETVIELREYLGAVLPLMGWRRPYGLQINFNLKDQPRAKVRGKTDQEERDDH